jgi:HEAT repeat protein
VARVLTVLAILVCATACGSTRSPEERAQAAADWSKARGADTVESYEAFRTRHPHDPHDADAQALIIWGRAQSVGAVSAELYPLLGDLLDRPTVRSRPPFPSKEERAFVDAVGRSGPDLAEPLLELLASEPAADLAMRWAVVRALGKTGNARAVEPLIRELQNPWLAKLAVQSLGELGDPRAAAPLVKSMRFGPYKGSEIPKALIRIGPFSVPPLVAELQDCPSHSNLLRALGSFDDARAVAALIGLLRQRHARGRALAANALGQHGGGAALGPLIESLDDPQPNVRGAAAGSLGSICASSELDGPRLETVVGPLIESLHDPDSVVRMSAARGLSRVCTAEALDEFRREAVLEHLIQALQDPKPAVRGSAASGLCRVGGPRATTALAEALENENLGAIAGPYGYFIRLGVPGSEPVLLRTLKVHGHLSMAEVYLNSGNPVLSKGAKEWLSDRSYGVRRVPGRTKTPKWKTASAPK